MTITDKIEIVDYEPKHHKYFKDLNVAWIQKSFFVEDVDIEVLDDPDKLILRPGGCILMALYEGEVAGTCSLKNKGNGLYELTKMTVDERMRGLRLGYHLGVATIERAKEIGAKKIELYSNTIGSAEAIPLYYKLGFKEIPLDTKEYQRANIKMILELE
ncbi:MAG TPA: GNAT family N-acetyltransferase [Flavipsychrobacter sp.]|nr:GNAT family N-acetyltransferase [Flavipsychrobacter sp.]